jgi:hypothetical protein
VYLYPSYPPPPFQLILFFFSFNSLALRRAESVSDAVVTPDAGVVSRPSSAWNEAAAHDPYDAVNKFVRGQKVSGESDKKTPTTTPAAKTQTAHKLSAVKSKNVQKIGSFFTTAAKKE